MASSEFIVSRSGRLTAETEIVDDCLLRLKNIGREWTLDSLRDTAVNYGVCWTIEQVKEAVELLRKEGIIEDVITPGPAPTPTTLADAVVVNPSIFD